MRKIIDWNQDWVVIKQNEKTEINLPHTWNAVDGQDGGNDYFRGTCVYEKHFDKPEFRDGERVFIEFAGAAMTAEVRLNGTVLTRHEGGYSAFRCDLTDHLAEQNVLTVAVDNSANDWVYPQKADFTFYGGIYRDVKLIIVPADQGRDARHQGDPCGRSGKAQRPCEGGNLAERDSGICYRQW